MRGIGILGPLPPDIGGAGLRGPRPIDNAPVAIIGASAAGATVCSIQFILMTGGLSGGGASLGTVLWFGLLGMLVAWALAAIAFCIGLLFIGLPAWAGLDRLGWMSPGVAVAAGAALAALVGGVLGGLWFGLFLFLPGAAGGWTLHHIAYGRVP